MADAGFAVILWPLTDKLTLLEEKNGGLLKGLFR
jgi:hypothetical protein